MQLAAHRCVALLAGLALACPSRALAQSAAPGATGAEPEQASGVRESQQHLRLAVRAFASHDYVVAIHEFELANRASPSADLWYNIARAHELLSHFDEAIEHYRRYLRDKVDPPDRADVERRIVALQRSAEQARQAGRSQDLAARIRFEVRHPGARVYLNDRLVGRSPILEPVTVAPGTQRLRVAGEGLQDWVAAVRVRRGETITAFATPAPATRYQSRSGAHLLSYLIGGLGVVGLGVGGYFAIQATSMDPCAGQPGGPCDRRESATVADVSFGLGAGLILAGAVVWLVEAASTRTDRTAGAVGHPAR